MSQLQIFMHFIFQRENDRNCLAKYDSTHQLLVSCRLTGAAGVGDMWYRCASWLRCCSVMWRWEESCCSVVFRKRPQQGGSKLFFFHPQLTKALGKETHISPEISHSGGDVSFVLF